MFFQKGALIFLPVFLSPGLCLINFRMDFTLTFGSCGLKTSRDMVKKSPLASHVTELSLQYLQSFSAICSRCNLENWPSSSGSRVTVVTTNLKELEHIFFSYHDLGIENGRVGSQMLSSYILRRPQKFCEISTFLWLTPVPVKKRWRFRKIVVAFSEYMNFKSAHKR